MKTTVAVRMGEPGGLAGGDLAVSDGVCCADNGVLAFASAPVPVPAPVPEWLPACGRVPVLMLLKMGIEANDDALDRLPTGSVLTLTLSLARSPAAPAPACPGDCEPCCCVVSAAETEVGSVE